MSAQGRDMGADRTLTYRLEVEIGGVVVGRTVEMAVPPRGDPAVFVRRLRAYAENIERATADVECGAQTIRAALQHSTSE